MSNPTSTKVFVLYELERLREMIGAFDDACLALSQPVPEKTRGILAKRIREAAQRGECDRKRLRDEALAHLKAISKNWV